MKNPNKILILFTHPALNKSRANKRLLQAVSDLKHVTIRDLYELYPDFFVDVAKEQQSLLEHDIILLQHPVYWYSSPALLKEWQDQVLLYGFAYGASGTALQGKHMLSAITMAGSKEAYQHTGVNRFTVREFLAPFEQTATLCNMTYLPPFTVHGSLTKETVAHLDETARDYRNLIVALRDGTLDPQAMLEFDTANDCLHLIDNESGESHAS